jgi:drug/metabolite transporter (DMT)-like permease
MRRTILLMATVALTLLVASGVALAVTKIGTNGPDTLLGTNKADNLVGLGVGAIFLDEQLTFSLLIGTALIVTGIYTVNRSSTGKDKHAN